MRLPAIILFSLAVATPVTAANAPDPAVARLMALFDDLCLQTFPDDAALDAAMERMEARPLTAEEVRRTFNDDPGRGWVLQDEGRSVQIMLELPPYHACSVRRGTSAGLDNAEPWRAMVDAFAGQHGQMTPDTPYEQVRDGIKISARVDFRPLPGGGRESLMVFEQQVMDPQRRANGETGVDLRFVRQIYTPPQR